MGWPYKKADGGGVRDNVMCQVWDLANMRAQSHNGKARDKHNKCTSLGAKHFTLKCKKFLKHFQGKKVSHTFGVKG